jgi:predicted aldo/keto reductase-like oxidoreductase
MKRREFLKGAAGAALLSCFPASLAGLEREKPAGGLERRALGRTGAKLSVIGFGALVLKNTSSEEAGRLVGEAMDAGVNYFDVAPSYGNSEERLGPPLAAHRGKVFLSNKTAQRKKTEALAELEKSLKLLRTDHFDLYQLHHVTSDQEVQTILGAGGALEALTEARQAGKTRWLGFSAHSVEAALELMAAFKFDTIMFPVNYATWNAGNFGPQVLAKAQEQGLGILALKAMLKRPWPRGADRSAAPNCWYEPMTEPTEALEGLRFTLSHPVTAALPPALPKCFRLALELGPKVTPLSAVEAAAAKEKAAQTGLLFKYPRA